MKSGAYIILNQVNWKLYVGSAVDFGRRWYEHKRELERKIHSNKHLQRAWDKYGEGAFLFMEHELCEPVKETLLAKEQLWLDFFRSYERSCGYNICRVAGSCMGFKHSEKTKKRASERLRGKGNPFYGKCHSDKTKQLLREKNLGKKTSEDVKRKISISLRGEKSYCSKLTEVEVKEIRSRYYAGGSLQKDLAKEYDVAQSTISKIVLNKKWAEENKTEECRRLSKTAQNRIMTPELREKISLSRRGVSCRLAVEKSKLLTWIVVEEIRRKYKPYFYTREMLAEEYGVSLGTIANIVGNMTWKIEEN